MVINNPFSFLIQMVILWMEDLPSPHNHNLLFESLSAIADMVNYYRTYSSL